MSEALERLNDSFIGDLAIVVKNFEQQEYVIEDILFNEDVELHKVIAEEGVYIIMCDSKQQSRVTGRFRITIDGLLGGGTDYTLLMTETRLRVDVCPSPGIAYWSRFNSDIHNYCRGCYSSYVIEIVWSYSISSGLNNLKLWNTIAKLDCDQSILIAFDHKKLRLGALIYKLTVHNCLRLSAD